ncbi:MAG: cytochrome c [Rhodospirillales bacterium]|nr:cytochrome c [Rhodospirillales bacterium]
MTERSKARLIGAMAGMAALLVALAATALIMIYSGGYNVAATEDHRSITRWAFNTAFRNSIENRAAQVTPPQLTATMINSGAGHYKATCQTCHGGPGAKRAEWASGMRPRPPHLAEAATEWELREIYWLAKHGAKMTGMPAFGPTHDDQTLWAIAAFVKELPGMTPELYQQAGKQSAEGGKPQEGH